MQTRPAADDATPDASDAIFVLRRRRHFTAPAVGDSVEVDRHRRREFGGTRPRSARRSPRRRDATPRARHGRLRVPCAPARPDGPPRPARPTRASSSPRRPFTVTNSFSRPTTFGEIGLATGDQAADQPDRGRGRPDRQLAALTAYNIARGDRPRRRLEQNFHRPAHPAATRCRGCTKDHTVRVGAGRSRRDASPASTVVLDYRNSAWKFQPQQPGQPASATGRRHLRAHPDRQRRPGRTSAATSSSAPSTC